MSRVPVAMQWQFNEESLRRKKYLKDLDFIKENTKVNLINIATVHGVVTRDKTVFVMTTQYFNCYECFGDAMFNNYKAEMDDFASVPLDGYCMDETGYMVLGFINDDFRARFYSEAQKNILIEY